MHAIKFLILFLHISCYVKGEEGQAIIPKNEVDLTPAQVHGTLREIPVNEYIQINATGMTFDIIPTDTSQGMLFRCGLTYFFIADHRPLS